MERIYQLPRHSERSDEGAESKNLRIFPVAVQIFGAKILRLAPLAQDDIPFCAMLNLTNKQPFIKRWHIDLSLFLLTEYNMAKTTFRNDYRKYYDEVIEYSINAHCKFSFHNAFIQVL